MLQVLEQLAEQDVSASLPVSQDLLAAFETFLPYFLASGKPFAHAPTIAKEIKNNLNFKQ